ncbi:helix-turn-helix transcriptional regulator [Actinosynnema sp. NPDC023587]|uniref:helix-turn-helix domain-containing protein n=1 Tax=Actinosynnema sp. NPDC023587 TaxID=3154695 RepID=UPI0033C07559
MDFVAWSASDMIAEQIHKRRKAAGLTRAQLAELCAAVGGPSLSPTVIGYIETGRRDADGRRRREVAVDELLIFAKAFEVSPLLLLFPLDEVGERTIGVLPGRELPMWLAAKWFTGEGPLGHRNPEDGRWYVDTDEFETWQRNNSPLDLRREHDYQVKRWNDAKGDAEWYRSVAETASTSAQRETALAAADAMESEARNLEDRLRETRREMKRSGLTPPELNDVLKYVDEEVRR